MRGMFELVPVQIAEAANEAWLAFPARQGVTVTRLGAYTRVVLTKPTDAAPALPQPAWA